MLDVELGMVGIQKKTELPISSCGRPLQQCDQLKNNYCVVFMEYIKDILPENNLNIIQSPGKGHYLLYYEIMEQSFYNQPHINILGYLKR